MCASSKPGNARTLRHRGGADRGERSGADELAGYVRSDLPSSYFAQSEADMQSDDRPRTSGGLTLGESTWKWLGRRSKVPKISLEKRLTR
jgi:hypothetical protein